MAPTPTRHMWPKRPMVLLLAAAIGGIVIADGLGDTSAGWMPAACLVAFSAWMILAVAEVARIRLNLKLKWLVGSVGTQLRRLALLVAVFAAFGCHYYAADSTMRALQSRFPAREKIPILARGLVVSPPCPLFGAVEPLIEGYERNFDPPTYDALDANTDTDTLPSKAQATFVFELRELIGATTPNALNLMARGGLERLRVYTDEPWPGLTCGEFIEIALTVYTPGPPTNPGEFDFAAYLRRNGLTRWAHWTCSTGLTRFPDRGETSLGTIAGMVRAHVIRLVHENLGEPYASLLLTMTIGASAGFDASFRDPFFLTGTVHVLVISGMNAALVAWLFAQLLAVMRLPMRGRAVTLIVVLVCYREVAGGDVAVTRAVIGMSLLQMGVLWWRPIDFPNWLAATALIALLTHPLGLFEAGFHLSFGAVFWIHYLGIPWPRELPGAKDPEQRIARWWRLGQWLWRHLGAGLRLSLVVTIGLAPILIAQFGLVSLSAVLINLVAVPLASLITGLSMPLLFLACVSITAGGLAPVDALCGWVAKLTQPLQAALIFVVQVGAQWPLGHINLPRVGDEWIAILVAAIGLIAFRRLLRLTPWRVAGILGLLGTLGIMLLLVRWQPKSPAAVVLDVPGSPCVILQTPAHHAIVVDPGNYTQRPLSKTVIGPALWWLGHSRIEAVVFTDLRGDQLLAMRDLHGRFPVRRMVLAQAWRLEPLARRAVEIAGELGIETVWVRPGDTLRIDGTDLEIWGPLANAASPAPRRCPALAVLWTLANPAGEFWIGDGDERELDSWAQLRRARPSQAPLAAVLPTDRRGVKMVPYWRDTFRPRIMVGHGDTAADFWSLDRHGATCIAFTPTGIQFGAWRDLDALRTPLTPTTEHLR